MYVCIYANIYIYKYEYIWFFQYTYTLLVSVSNVEGVVMPSGSNAWHYWLVVNLPLWKIYEFVSWDDYIFPIYGKKCSKPPTSIYIYIYIYMYLELQRYTNFCSSKFLLEEPKSARFTYFCSRYRIALVVGPVFLNQWQSVKTQEVLVWSRLVNFCLWWKNALDLPKTYTNKQTTRN